MTMSNPEMRDLVARAHEAGMKAGMEVNPTPMTLVNRASGETFVVSEGPCGFAWINVRPGGSRFARFLKAEGIARSAYGGGVDIWVSEFNQSHTRKAAYAAAYSRVLQMAGIKAYSQERLD